MPEVGEQVVVHGYPMGGDALSTTAGVISRIEMTLNFYSIESVLSVQIDAALNPGNSGGPVLNNGKIVGIASSLLEEADGVGFMVPPPVIQHFLEDIEDGTLDGIPMLELSGQLLESDALRGSLGLDTEDGVLVNRVAYGSSAWGVLQPGDVLLEFDGYTIGVDGTVMSEYGTRLDYYYLVRNRQVGETVGVKLWRDGEELEREITLNRQGLRAFTSHEEPRPGYRIFAGLLFQPLSYDYLMLFEGSTPPGLFYCASYELLATESRRRWIVLNQVLPHELTRGYQEWSDLVVDTVNGRIPLDMADLNQILDTTDDPWLRIRFLDGDSIVLDLAAARAAEAEILENFGVGSDRYPPTPSR
jgi:hypothetical protein